MPYNKYKNLMFTALGIGIGLLPGCIKASPNDAYPINKPPLINLLLIEENDDRLMVIYCDYVAEDDHKCPI